MHEGRRRLVTTAINSSWRISRLRTANTLDLCAMDVRGGEGRRGEGGKEVGGKGPLRGIDIPRRRRRRPRLLLSPLLLLLLPLISTLAEAERRESFDSLSLSANPSFSLFFPSRREDRSKPPCLHRDAMICQINRFPPFFRPLLPPLIPALDFAISTLPPSLEGGGREGGEACSRRGQKPRIILAAERLSLTGRGMGRAVISNEPVSPLEGEGGRRRASRKNLSLSLSLCSGGVTAKRDR